MNELIKTMASVFLGIEILNWKLSDFDLKRGASGAIMVGTSGSEKGVPIGVESTDSEIGA